MFSGESVSPITWLRNSAASGMVKRKSIGAQFGQMAPGAQSGERQSWILTCGDHQVHVRRQVIEQKGKSLLNGLASIT